MMPSHLWARNIVISKQDIEYLTGLLLEKEIPLTTADLARALIQERIRREAADLAERYQGALIYNPAMTYPVGQRLIFPALAYATGTTTAERPGNNADYGSFRVMAVTFDDAHLNPDSGSREFATGLSTPHKLSQADQADASPSTVTASLDPDEILSSAGEDLLKKLREALSASPELIHMARHWFPRDLLLEANIGHLNLAEAVLDMAGGGPMTTEAILEQIGGLGNAPIELQVFSLNYALNQDNRFDEVGPTGEVLWHLTRLEPQEVRQTPAALRYTDIPYDRSLLLPEMLALEAEIGDEWSPLPDDLQAGSEAAISLIFPHRRLGTLPVNARTAAVLPTARQTERVWFRLVDGQDGEEYPAWVVRKERYVYGLAQFYRKHKLPIGALLRLRQADEEGKVMIDFNAYRARTEWIRLIVPKNDGISFENNRRLIGAEYDELMILGADDIAGVDAAFQTAQQQRKSLVAILKMLIPALGALTPQNTVHAKTLYSAVNVLRRCPPGPIFAALAANPEFENVGGHYWKLRFD